MENTNLFTQFNQNAKIDPLAIGTHLAFLPYIDHRHWTLADFDGSNKRPSINKAEFVARSKWCEQKNAGVDKPQVIIRRQDGTPWTDYKKGGFKKFNYELNYARKQFYRYSEEKSYIELNAYTLERLTQCIRGEKTPYYMCKNMAGKKLPYLDLDCHKEWQDDLEEAIALVKSLFGDQPFWRYSMNGYNGWLKLGNAPKAEQYNKAMKRMQQVLSDVFASEKIKTEIEIKGWSSNSRLIESWQDTGTNVAKMPCWQRQAPCYRMDDKDIWNQERLNEFNALPDYDFNSLVREIETLASKLDPEKVEEGRAYLSQFDDKKKKKAAEALIDIQPLQTASVISVKPVVAPDIVPEEQTKKEADKIQLPLSLHSSTPPATPVDLSLGCSATDSLDDIRKITDAFERNRLFAFWCNRKAKRPLSPDELLELDYKHNIYNGDWQEGLNNRVRRYNDIAPFAANGFDPSKCGDKSQRPILDENIKEWKSKAHIFPKVAYGYCGSEENKKTIKVKRDTLIVLTAIIQTASKDNKDCPRLTIQSWWEELAEEGILPNWHTDTYIAARSILVRYKLICVDHDCYWWSPDRRGQCKRIWIREQKEVGERNYTFPLSPLSLHKGYNQKVIENETGSVLEMAGKPPP
ncbi:MAG: hypothetical protein CME33_17745 [Gimesia sp.]|mgnify:CR=1 FL=1|uniref:hypothetical protein n=1 Tax=Gimesia sp. TaxID=2024833 RepID=UPI000C3BEFE6|nr:hypothetical protein [Gimesia sp.]MAX38401.1 hypothetical protein [Gimesia sp.]|tara:strand:+ start:9749 stop:11650 length:1902 start_codon:yes stop_codon:yes gene_type:complete